MSFIRSSSTSSNKKLVSIGTDFISVATIFTPQKSERMNELTDGETVTTAIGNYQLQARTTSNTRQTDGQIEIEPNKRKKKRSRKSPINCCKILNSFILAPHVCHVSQLKFYLWNRSDIKYEINYLLKYAAKELSDSQRLQSRNVLW